MPEFQSTKILKDIHLIGVKKYLSLKTLKILYLGHM